MEQLRLISQKFAPLQKTIIRAIFPLISILLFVSLITLFVVRFSFLDTKNKLLDITFGVFLRNILKSNVKIFHFS